MKNNDDDDFIGQGSYGCIYKRKIKCLNPRDNKGPTKNILSKVQRSKRTALKEIAISKHIKNIPDYDRYFSPILNDCTVSLAQINKKDADQCEFIKNDSASTSTSSMAPNTYYMTHSKYIIGKPLDEYFYDYITKNKSRQRIYDKLMYFCVYLLHAVSTLNEAHIIHFDIKDLNIIIDRTDRPILIDYGLSIYTPDVKQSLEETFFFHPFPKTRTEPVDSYEPWCVEIAWLSYLTKIVGLDKIFTETHRDELQSISDRYIDALKLHETKIFTKEEIEAYKTKKRNIIGRFPDRLSKDIIMEVYEHTHMNWDPYAVCIMIANYIGHYVDTSLLRQDHKELLQTAILF